MTRKSFICLNLLMAFLVATIFVIIAMALIPINVLTFYANEYKVHTPKVHPGGVVQYDIKLYKHYAIPGTISRQLINSYIYNYTPIIGNIPVGLTKSMITVELPLYIEPGTYFIRTGYQYEIHPLRTEKYTHDTEKFEVIK